MKNMSVKSVCAVALSIASFVGFAGAPIAIWESFNGLSEESPLEPSYSSVYNQIDGSIWRFNLGGGSVQDGVLCTGTGPAPYISFGETVPGTQNIIDVGRDGHPFTVVMAIETPVSAPSTGNPPYVHMGNGNTGVGMAYVDSTKVCGTWNNAAWNATQEAKQETLTALGEQSSVTYLAFSAAITSANSAVAVIDPEANEISWGIIDGLTGVGVNASQINFGNYLNRNTDGLSYKLKGVAVIDGRPTIDELRTVMAFMDSPVLVIDSDMMINSDYNGTLGRISIKEGVTVTVTDSSKITENTEIYGKGTIVYDGFIPSSKSGLNTCFWTGTAKVLNFEGRGNQGAAEFDVDGLGSASSVIELENDKGWIAGGTAFHNLKLSGDGFAFNNGSSTTRATITVENLIGSGLFAGAQNNAWKYGVQVKNMDSFAGSIDMSSNNSREIAFLNGSDTAKFAVGKIVIAKTAKIAAGKVWKAINGVQILSTGTLSGTGEVDSQLVFEAGATLDVADGFLTVNNEVQLPQSGTITVKIAEDETVDVNEPGTIIACSNANDLDLSKIVLSPEPNFRYVLKARGGKVVYERASGFSVIVR